MVGRKAANSAAASHMHTPSFLTAGSVDDISQLSILPLAQVVLFHTGSSFVGLHLRTPAGDSRCVRRRKTTPRSNNGTLLTSVLHGDELTRPFLTRSDSNSTRRPQNVGADVSALPSAVLPSSMFVYSLSQPPDVCRRFPAGVRLPGRGRAAAAAAGLSRSSS